MFTMEVNNKLKGSRMVEIIASTTPWFLFQEKLAELFNVYPGLLHAQYRFSTDPKCSLPLDLTMQVHYEMLITLLRPLVVPQRLRSGKRSTRKMKPVTVQVFNKADEPLSAEGCGGNKVSYSLYMKWWPTLLCRKLEVQSLGVTALAINEKLKVKSFMRSELLRGRQSQTSFHVMFTAFPTSRPCAGKTQFTARATPLLRAISTSGPRCMQVFSALIYKAS
jgi:hypothetical protein